MSELEDRIEQMSFMGDGSLEIEFSYSYKETVKQLSKVTLQTDIEEGKEN